MRLWIKTKWWIRLLFPKYIWNIKSIEKKVYLTFDDGPTPEVTPWVLEELNKFNAEATFFCIGDNIRKYPEILNTIILAGHSLGNHTFNHLNGWKTKTQDYINNIEECRKILEKKHSIYTKLFRPPYGKIKPYQSQILRKKGFKIIMWDVLSYDFEVNISGEECLNNVLKNLEKGSIIVFHDSKKGEYNLRYVLPKVLQYLKENDYSCEKIA